MQGYLLFLFDAKKKKVTKRKTAGSKLRPEFVAFLCAIVAEIVIRLTVF